MSTNSYGILQSPALILDSKMFRNDESSFLQIIRENVTKNAALSYALYVRTSE